MAKKTQHALYDSAGLTHSFWPLAGLGSAETKITNRRPERIDLRGLVRSVVRTSPVAVPITPEAAAKQPTYRLLRSHPPPGRARAEDQGEIARARELSRYRPPTSAAFATGASREEGRS